MLPAGFVFQFFPLSRKDNFSLTSMKIYIDFNKNVYQCHPAQPKQSLKRQ